MEDCRICSLSTTWLLFSSCLALLFSFVSVLLHPVWLLSYTEIHSQLNSLLDRILQGKGKCCGWTWFNARKYETEMDIKGTKKHWLIISTKLLVPYKVNIWWLIFADLQVSTIPVMKHCTWQNYPGQRWRKHKTKTKIQIHCKYITTINNYTITMTHTCSLTYIATQRVRNKQMDEKAASVCQKHTHREETVSFFITSCVLQSHFNN